ncbi:MAG: HlyD family efflux transporter periplasmic adaptor subunit [Magnetococcales bacterium]|nr:HlyD family efflux transporter periplasmic adaptor subunit [Magnetococcales bacterium]
MDVDRTNRKPSDREWLVALIDLETTLRHAGTLDAAARIIVNDTRNVFPFRQAILFDRSFGKRWRVRNASDVVDPDPKGPFLSWLTLFLNQWMPQGGHQKPQRIDASLLPEHQRHSWEQWLPPFGYWIPLVTVAGPLPGGVFLFCDTMLAEHEWQRLEHLAFSFGQTWERLVLLEQCIHPKRWLARMTPGRATFFVVILVTAIAFIPVHLSVLAPARIVPIDPVAMNSPLDGVVAQVFVQPNQEVKKGDPLFRLEDTELKNRHAVALKALEVESAQLEQVRRKGFHEDRSRAEVALAQAMVAMKRAEAQFAAEQLTLVEVRALRNGVAVFNDPNQWLGQPVRVGETVMSLADPGRMEVEAWIPVADAITLEHGTPVEMFLNIHPYQPLAARLWMADFEARHSPEGLLGFRVRARFEEESPLARLGLRGSARFQGTRVRLWYYLLRRPLAFLRQQTGW